MTEKISLSYYLFCCRWTGPIRPEGMRGPIFFVRLLTHMFAIDKDIGHLPHFTQINSQACGLWRSGVVLLAGEGSAEAVDTPFAGGSLPSEHTVLHLAGEVYGLLYWGVRGRCGECQQVS